MPRTEEQYKEIREKSRNLILQTALKLFAKKGYHGTSIADIAKEAEISKGLAYNYFKSKRELVEAVLLLLNDLVDQMYGEISSIPDPYEQIKKIIIDVIDNIKENEEFWELYFGLSLQQDVLEISKEILSKNMDQLFGMLETIFKEMGLNDPKAEARIFGAILDGVGFHYIYDKENYPLEKVKQQMIIRYSPEGLSHLKK